MGACMLNNNRRQSSNNSSFDSELSKNIRSELNQFPAFTFEAKSDTFTKERQEKQKQNILEEESSTKRVNCGKKISPDEKQKKIKSTNNSIIKKTRNKQESFKDMEQCNKQNYVSQDNSDEDIENQQPPQFCKISGNESKVKALQRKCNAQNKQIINQIKDERQRKLILATLKQKIKIELQLIVFEDGSTYKGGWLKAKRSGKGVYCFNGNKYQGDWENDLMHGKGVYTFKNRDVYQGEFVRGKAQGNGRFKDGHGTTYEGNWRDNKKQGFGFEVYDIGEYYEGEWKNNYKHGRGHLQFNDGSYCKGHFMDNFISGYAEYSWFNQKIYKGQWFQNRMDGRGIMQWKNGKKYQGQYANDKQQGKGKLSIPGEGVYIGFWKNGKKNGKGQFKYQNGKISKGLWYQDRLIEEDTSAL